MPLLVVEIDFPLLQYKIKMKPARDDDGQSSTQLDIPTLIDKFLLIQMSLDFWTVCAITGMSELYTQLHVHNHQPQYWKRLIYCLCTTLRDVLMKADW